MFKTKYIYIILFIVIIGCKLKKEQTKYNLNDLIGYWAESEKEDVAFSFEKDGVIKYFDYDDGYIYNYVVNKKILTIEEDKHIIAKYDILKMTSDSLVLKN